MVNAPAVGDAPREFFGWLDPQRAALHETDRRHPRVQDDTSLAVQAAVPPLGPAPKIVAARRSWSRFIASHRAQQQRASRLRTSLRYNIGDQPRRTRQCPPAPTRALTQRRDWRRAGGGRVRHRLARWAYRLLADARRDEAEARREAIKRDHDFAAQLMRRGPEIAALPLPPEMCLPQQSGSPDRPFVQVKPAMDQDACEKLADGASPTRLERKGGM